MYAVIFKAKINKLDSRYKKMAEQMRILAMKKYVCTEFVSVTENNQEIATSYWQNQQQIQAWKADAEHIVVQELGKTD